jgi:hypothetical protein
MKSHRLVRRPAVALALPVATGLCAALMMVVVPGALGTGHHSARKRLILSPRPGQTVSSRPLTIRIHTGVRGRGLRVSINGQAIGRYFSRPSRRGVRQLSASSSFGLRHGNNRLVVDLRGAHGELRSRTVRFRVRRNRPLAGAGFDRTVAVGARVYLSGHRSRNHIVGSGFGASPSSPLRHRWKIVRAPGGKVPGRGLRGSRSPRPRLVVRKPGKYVVRLSVRASDGKVGSDLVDVRADPPPAEPVDTMASGPNGSTGIKVGEDFYPAKPGAWAQLVTLDRGTLEPVKGKVADLANKSYPCPGAAYGDSSFLKCTAALAADLNRLDGHDLVIVSNPVGTGSGQGTPAYGVYAALSRIGVSQTGFSNQPGLLPGSISAIGAPGTAPGKGNWHAVATSKREGDGRMRDYLIRNNEGDYVFAPSDRVEFNTQAAGSTEAAGVNHAVNVVQVGDRRFSEDLGGSQGGLQVVVMDAQTLDGISHWYGTSSGSASSVISQLDSIRDVLKQANAVGHDLVFIASRGLPAVSPGANDSQWATINSDLQSIADQVELLGGTRSGIFDALDPKLSQDDSYALVGSSYAGGGNGQEALVPNTPSKPGDSALSLAPMSGTMARTGPNYGFAVQAVPTVGASPADGGPNPATAAAQLNDLLVQAPSDWPEQGNAGRRSAIAYVGREVFGTNDPRAQYWTVIYKPDTWNGYSDRIGKLEYPAGEPSFSSGDLDWAKAELEREIGWLKNIHNYLENLAQPFSKTELQNWAAFEQISNSIRDEVGVGVDQKTIATQKALWQGFRQILAATPKVGEAFHAADAIYETVMQLVEINGEPAEDDFQAKANELGKKLAERLIAEQGMLTRQIPNTIAADYGKLRAAGSCASTDPKGWAACPFDHADWEFTQDDQENAARALVPGMEAWAYGSLLPTRYNLYRLPPWWRTTVGDNKDFYGRTYGQSFWPFDGLPASAQVAKPMYRNLPTGGHTLTSHVLDPWTSSGDTWQIYALGYLTGDGTITDRWVMHYPQAGVTAPIFKPVDQGGLGADPESFFDRYFPKVSTLDHYPERDTPTGWCVFGPLGCPY